MIIKFFKNVILLGIAGVFLTLSIQKDWCYFKFIKEKKVAKAAIVKSEISDSTSPKEVNVRVHFCNEYISDTSEREFVYNNTSNDLNTPLNIAYCKSYSLIESADHPKIKRSALIAGIIGTILLLGVFVVMSKEVWKALSRN